jgi:hypothetical protein
MNLDEMRFDSAYRQKKGLHFILASILIWTAVFIVHLTDLPILTKNLLTFCFTAPLLPLAFAISKVIRVDFTNKGNPIEYLWRNIKKQATHLRYFKSFTELSDKVEEKLKHFADLPQSILALMGKYCESLGAEAVPVN